MNNFLRIAVLGFVLFFAGAAVAQLKPQIPVESATTRAKVISLPESVPQLQRLASKAYAQKKYRAFVKIMEKLRLLRPLDTGYMYQQVLGYSLVDNKTAAYDLMLSMQRQGAAYDFNSTDDSKNIRGTEVYEYVNKLMVQAGEPVGSVENVLTLDDDVVLPEAIDWDPVNEAFLIGTISDGKILQIKDGKSSTIYQADSENGMWSIYDIKVDTKREIFWVSSAAQPGFKGYEKKDFGRSALFKFDLKSGKLLQHIPMALDGRPHAFANMALADDGSVYVADSQAPVIYVLKPGDKSAEVFVASPQLLSIRSLLLNKDNTYLYLSDYSKGLFLVNLKTGEMRAPRMPETLNTSGIDGMYRWQDSLVVIQNGFQPSRILRLQLDEDGVEIVKMAPLAVAQPVFDNPNYGVIRGDWLYYFANSHWGLVDAAGHVPKPVKIIRTRVDEAPDLANPILEDILKQMEKSSAPETETLN